jgi:L-lactate dehydrogenase complex protein LldG
MNREQMLENIRAAKPPEAELPVFDSARFETRREKAATFQRNVEAVGGAYIDLRHGEPIATTIQRLYPDAREIISLVEDAPVGTIERSKISSARDLENLDLAIIEGQFGVAENGAVWVTDKHIHHRSIPFIARHVVIVLDREQIVENMHQACARLSSARDPYGVFISGPSKTADIEQSLVIGAHGPLSLTILVRP